MITAFVAVVILALVITLVVVIAKDRGPGPGEVAVAYELAWDRLDFESLYTLSGLELRDGLDRRGFITAKRGAYAQQRDLGGLVERVGIDQVADSRDAAVAIMSARGRRARSRARHRIPRQSASSTRDGSTATRSTCHAMSSVASGTASGGAPRFASATQREATPNVRSPATAATAHHRHPERSGSASDRRSAGSRDQLMASTAASPSQ